MIPSFDRMLCLFLICFYQISSCGSQSIPLVANPSGFRPDDNLLNRYPGPNIAPPVNPFVNLLGNLLGGLGPVPNNNFAPPPIRYPQSARLLSPDSVIECSAVISPQTILHSVHSDRPRPNHDVLTDASNKTGFCVPNPMDCRARGGSLLGPCLQFQAPNMPPQVFGACCYFEATCGQTIRVNGTHFRSPNFPDPYPTPGSCQVTIRNTYPSVCQVRLDFLVFNLKQPVQGNCNSDRFVVNGQASNDIIPSICGFNPDQHSELDWNAFEHIS